MEQKDTELLLKDLCARLPYGVKVAYDEEICDLDSICSDNSILLIGEDGFIPDITDGLFTSIDKIKPYLRPMSSMTEEENEEYSSFFIYDRVEYPSDYIDWINEHHFDCRGLIEKGLALEAPEGMYKERRLR